MVFGCTISAYSAYMNGTYYTNHTIIWICPSVRPSVPHLLGRLWTDRVQTRQERRGWDPAGAKGMRFHDNQTVAMEIWKCGLWGPIWPWSTRILVPGPLKILIKWTRKFFDYLGILHFLPVSMETWKIRFWGSRNWKLWYISGGEAEVKYCMVS